LIPSAKNLSYRSKPITLRKLPSRSLSRQIRASSAKFAAPEHQIASSDQSQSKPTANVVPLSAARFAQIMVKNRLDPLGIFSDAIRFASSSNSIVHLPYGSYLIHHPAHIRTIFQGESARSFEKDWVYDEMALIWGKSLLTSEGNIWKLQNEMTKGYFSSRNISAFTPQMVDRTLALIDRLRFQSRSGEPVNMHEEMRRLTFEIGGDIFFNTDLSDLFEEMTHATKALTRAIFHNVGPLRILKPLWKALRFRLKPHLQVLKNVVDQVLESPTSQSPGTFIHWVTQKQVDQGLKPMPENLLRFNIIMLLMASHETTASTLTWAPYYLAKNPQWLPNLRMEYQERIADPSSASYEDFKSLAYFDRVFKETNRLAPSVYTFPRRSNQETEVGGQRFAENSSLLVFSHATHRHPDFWEFPGQFYPDHFLPEVHAQRDAYAYIPRLNIL